MIGFAATLLGSKAGRTALVVLLVLASTALILWRTFAAGKQSAATDQLRASLDAVRQKVQTDEEVRSLSPDARRERLREWVRG